MGVKISIDVGGTFTDFVAYDSESGRFYLLKLDSTPEEPEKAVLRTCEYFLKDSGKKGEDIEVVLHVGTVGTNLFRGQLKLRLPKTALITTKGFRDVLVIGRQNRPELYNVFFEKPKPLVERRFRVEVDERVDAQGRVLKHVNEEEINLVFTRLKKEGVEAIAISFLNSYINPRNEQIVEKKAKEAGFQHVSAAYNVDREAREYERTSTTVVNAILKPVVVSYLNRLRFGLSSLGIRASVYILLSSGGLSDIDEVSSRPVAAVESGPAAGVVAAAALADTMQLGNVISFDMGGTTAKACAVVEGKPGMVTEFELGGKVHAGRMVKGSGYPIRVPCIDLAEVSAGGGSIIWVTEGGAVEVGPISAGASPGPACYGKGGKDPTVTDANLTLNRLPQNLLDGKFQINRTLARRALRRVADEAGVDVTELAILAIRLINLHMARALRLVTVERGHDPREFTLIAFGGAGPLHAAELANEMDISKVIIPRYPGLFSSYGLMFTDLRYDRVTAYMQVFEGEEYDYVEDKYIELEQEIINYLTSKGFEISRITLGRLADVRYLGQAHELLIDAPARFNDKTARAFIEHFHAKHEATYGYSRRGEKLEIVALRVYAVVKTSKPKLETYRQEREKPEKDALKEKREIYLNDTWVKASVYNRDKLRCGNRIQGPAVVEQYDSTTLIPEGWIASVDQYLNIILTSRG
ncbi:MAG TPA: hydantoinase/oxoprolinase family protein [Candidatus Caldiarchaeum subterraneum]|uniref:Hydantoinase/oxoprolinase family protein n=1 Tax=Caldiarchaeum subterraneum TaxID=311458 RepID=A0A832ZUE7_CALS0|nr:hydantoinase/oxoprolinase family protein [Candidatus Caldarchaeum subterraneum]